jgi:hypothetical protein
VADAYVAGHATSKNYGSATDLQSDASPVRATYLRFDLRGVAAPVSRATLRMYLTDGTRGSQTIWNVEDDSWGEAALTYASRPPRTTAAKAFTPGTTKGRYVDVDVTALVGANAGSLMSLVIDSASSDGYAFNSKEAATNRVQLIIS